MDSVISVVSAVSDTDDCLVTGEESLVAHVLQRFPNATELQGNSFYCFMHNIETIPMTELISEHRRHSILKLRNNFSKDKRPPPLDSMALINAINVFPNICELGTLVLTVPTAEHPYLVHHSPTSPRVLRPTVRVLHVHYYTQVAFQPCKQSKVVEETLGFLSQFPALDRVTVNIALFRHGRSASLVPGLFLTTLIKKMTTTAARIEVHIEDADGKPLGECLEDSKWKFDMVWGLQSWPKVLGTWDGTGKAVVVADKRLEVGGRDAGTEERADLGDRLS
ncbi:hypothetical protein HDU93_009769 [Gonapodya sp. JEL0774]|nr:hypothetical protein HDU93_009769 [Gonapodya sp. JEL0774]